MGVWRMGEVQSISDFLFPFLVTFSAAMCYAKCMSHISFPKSTRHTLLPFFSFHHFFLYLFFLFISTDSESRVEGS